MSKAGARDDGTRVAARRRARHAALRGRRCSVSAAVREATGPMADTQRRSAPMVTETTCWILRALVRCGAVHAANPPRRVGIDVLRAMGVAVPDEVRDAALRDARVQRALGD